MMGKNAFLSQQLIDKLSGILISTFFPLPIQVFTGDILDIDYDDLDGSRWEKVEIKIPDNFVDQLLGKEKAQLLQSSHHEIIVPRVNIEEGPFAQAGNSECPLPLQAL